MWTFCSKLGGIIGNTHVSGLCQQGTVCIHFIHPCSIVSLLSSFHWVTLSTKEQFLLCLRNKTLCWGLYGLAQGWSRVMFFWVFHIRINCLQWTCCMNSQYNLYAFTLQDTLNTISPCGTVSPSISTFLLQHGGHLKTTVTECMKLGSTM